MLGCATGVTVSSPSMSDLSRPASATARAASLVAISIAVRLSGCLLEGISAKPVIAALLFRLMIGIPVLVVIIVGQKKNGLQGHSRKLLSFLCTGRAQR
jgi:hypothetical protein